MKNFNCRTVNPKRTGWVSVKAESCGEAANEYQCNRNRSSFQWRTADGTHIHLARIEVEGHGEFFARSFHRGITRIGRPNTLPLSKIAELLGYDEEPESLITPGWEGEEENYGTTKDATG